eukprot:scaffold88781_cov18-Tisochrysis_lutea.AAC.1
MVGAGGRRRRRIGFGIAEGNQYSIGRYDEILDLLGKSRGKRLCCAGRSSLPMSMLTTGKPAPQGLFVKSFCDHSPSY